MAGDTGSRSRPAATRAALLLLAALAACAPASTGPAPTPAPTPAPAPPAPPAPPANEAPPASEAARTAWTAAFPDADTVDVEAVAPGVRHVRLWFAEGPWAVHVVEVDRGVCAPVVRAEKAGPPLEARATTSALAGDALAAINADFFMLPGGTTVGAHVRAGRVLVGPGARPAYLLDAAGGRWAGPAALAGWVAVPGDTAPLAQVNRPRDAGRHHPMGPGLTLYDAWFGEHAPVDSAAATVRLRRIDAVRGVVLSRHEAGDTVPLDTGHAALRATGDGAAAWLARRTPGDTVSWRAILVPAPEAGRSEPGATAEAEGTEKAKGTEKAEARAAVEAVGGFPLLLAGGRGVYGEQEGVSAGFGDARHPRTAVAWAGTDGRVFWVVVDGRQSPYSDGMSLAELEALLLRMGATDGLNLDGGGSTAMVVRGRVVNRPSDREGERPVANALVLEACPALGPAARR